MPISYTDVNEITRYLIPAPMVSINKEYDTTGDGAVIGTRYSITLTGKLLASHGSPSSDALWSSVGGVGTVNDRHGAATYHDIDESGSINNDQQFYRSIQNKQKALSNLFSRTNEGGLLHIIPIDNASAGGSTIGGYAASGGIKCFPRILGIDVSQKPGMPMIMDYTIKLEADELLGPYRASGTTGVAANESDQEAPTNLYSELGQGLAGGFYRVQGAEENWNIEEHDKRQLHYKKTEAHYRHKRLEPGMSGASITEAAYVNLSITCSGSNDKLKSLATNCKKNYEYASGGWTINKTLKTYILTHSMSATGKRAYDQTTNRAGDLKEDGTAPTGGTPPTASGDDQDKLGGIIGTGYGRINNEEDKIADGEAWQQARGYVLNHLSNTNRGLSGDGTSRQSGYQGDLADTAEPGTWPVGLPTHDGGFVDLFGINLPRIKTAGADLGKHQYTGHDYKRVQQIDKTAGTFGVTETWILADRTVQNIIETNASLAHNPSYADAAAFYAANDIGRVLETLEVSIDESTEGEGLIEVSINGSMEGIVETRLEDFSAYGEHGLAIGNTPPVGAGLEADTDVVWNADDYDTTTGFLGKDTTAARIVQTSKYEEASRRWAWLEPKLQQIAQTTAGFGSKRRLSGVPKNKTITRNPVEGTINYSLSFSTGAGNCFDCVLDEQVSVNDTHPNHVFAETAVLGRRLGPVLQDIGTQTSWKRQLSVELVVSGVVHGCQWDEAMKNKPSMRVAGCFHAGLSPGDCSSAGFSYVVPADELCNTGGKLRDVIDDISPRGKDGINAYYVSAGPTESWDAINGQYTFNIEWTYELQEGPWNDDPTGLALAVGRSYLGTQMFQYPRTITRKKQSDHEKDEKLIHGTVKHHRAF